MRRNVVLSTNNRAPYPDQTKAIMYKKRVARSFISTCDLSYI